MGSGYLEFLGDQVVEFEGTVPDPVGQGLLGQDRPVVSFLMHFKHDPVSAVIAYVHRKQFFVQSVDFSEIKLADIVNNLNPGLNLKFFIIIYE